MYATKTMRGRDNRILTASRLVMTDGGFADPQDLRDLMSGLTTRHELYHLTLPIRKSVHDRFGTRLGGLAARQRLRAVRAQQAP